MSQLKFMSHHAQGGWTLKQVYERVGCFRKLQNKGEFLHFIVINKATHEPMGTCSLKEVSLEHRNAEFGLIIHHRCWGQGVAEECHLMCLDYAFRVLRLHRVEFLTLATNKRMQAFFVKAGISLEGIKKGKMCVGGKFVDEFIYALFDQQWTKVRQRLIERIKRKLSQCQVR